MELVFDFGSDDGAGGGGLDKVFFDHDNEKWSSRVTQRMPRLDPNAKPPE